MLCFPNLRNQNNSVHASLPKYTALAASADGCLQHMATTKWTLLFEHPINRTFAAVLANVSHIIVMSVRLSGTYIGKYTSGFAVC